MKKHNRYLTDKEWEVIFERRLHPNVIERFIEKRRKAAEEWYAGPPQEFPGVDEEC